MGATIVVDQEAAAFKPQGAAHVVWCLFEKLYDKNTYPHYPEWNCVAIGRIEAALARVFESASYCEGGMNQSRGGHIRPETYIERWLNAMSNPIVMPELEVALTQPEPAESAGRNEEHAAQWANVRERYGALAPAHASEGIRVIERLERGEPVRVSLHRHPDLISAVLAERHWQGIPSHIVTAVIGMNPRRAEMGYRPPPAAAAWVRKALAAVPRPEMRRIDSHTRIERVDGVWKEAGWPYSIVGSYVRGLWKQELEAPGVYKRLINEYRKAVEAAPPVPAGTTVRVPLAALPACDRDVVIKLAAECGGEVKDEEARIPWAAPDRTAAVHFLLRGKDVTWDVPESAEQPLQGKQEVLALPEPASAAIHRSATRRGVPPARGDDGVER